jgi:hypothetical protein
VTRKNSKGAARPTQPPIKLSTPANVKAVWKLLQTEADHVYEPYAEMISDAGINLESREIFDAVFVKAARLVERGDAPASVREYNYLAELVTRTRAGESVEDVARDRKARSDAYVTRALRRRLKAREPKDKLSAEWRYWKLRQLEEDFSGRRGDEARQRAGREFRELLDGLTAEPLFWHTPTLISLLPQLIIARQEIDEIHAREKAADVKKK